MSLAHLLPGLLALAPLLGCGAPQRAPASADPASAEVELPDHGVDAVFTAHAMGVRVQIAFGDGAAAEQVALVERCFAEVRRLEHAARPGRCGPSP